MIRFFIGTILLVLAFQKKSFSQNSILGVLGTYGKTTTESQGDPNVIGKDFKGFGLSYTHGFKNNIFLESNLIFGRTEINSDHFNYVRINTNGNTIPFKQFRNYRLFFTELSIPVLIGYKFGKLVFFSPSMGLAYATIIKTELDNTNYKEDYSEYFNGHNFRFLLDISGGVFLSKKISLTAKFRYQRELISSSSIIPNNTFTYKIHSTLGLFTVNYLIK